MFSQALSFHFLQFLLQVFLDIHSLSIQKSFSRSKSVSGQKMQISGISSAFSGLRKSIWNCDFTPTLMELLPTCRSLCTPDTASQEFILCAELLMEQEMFGFPFEDQFHLKFHGPEHAQVVLSKKSPGKKKDKKSL